jgi:hypothetical protein
VTTLPRGDMILMNIHYFQENNKKVVCVLSVDGLEVQGCHAQEQFELLAEGA